MLQLCLFPGQEATNASGSTVLFGYFICLFLNLTVNSKYVLRAGSVLSRTKNTVAKKINRKHNMEVFIHCSYREILASSGWLFFQKIKVEFYCEEKEGSSSTAAGLFRLLLLISAVE